jgi:hypothetical protein
MFASVPLDGEFAFVFRGEVFDDQRRVIDSLLQARTEHVTSTVSEVVLHCRRVETGRSTTIRLLAADGAPVADVPIVLAISGYGAGRKSTTDAGGRARFDDLPAHEFRVAAVRQGSLRPPPTTVVPAGQEVVLRLPAAVAVTGTVVWAGGEPAKGALLMEMAQGDTVPILMVKADEAGRFSVQVPIDDPRALTLKATAAREGTRGSGECPITPQDRDLRVELKEP